MIGQINTPAHLAREKPRRKGLPQVQILDLKYPTPRSVGRCKFDVQEVHRKFCTADLRKFENTHKSVIKFENAPKSVSFCT